MKKVMYFLLLLFAIIQITCKPRSTQSKSGVGEQKKRFNFSSTRKLNKSLATFYAVCYEEHSGWCSAKCSTYVDASEELEKHRKATGHKDNSVDNECLPGLASTNPVSQQLAELKKTLVPTSETIFMQKIAEYQNPLMAAGVQFTKRKFTASAAMIGSRGGGQVPAPGAQVSLGGSTAGTSVTVNVGGEATVKIGMWFLLAQTAAGQWTVAGPGSKTFQLNCNVLQPFPPGCPLWFGQSVSITAEGINGTFPVWVSFN
jgi:hypothetical protein